jgi:membrane fusion protein (multidrug efflux system)
MRSGAFASPVVARVATVLLAAAAATFVTGCERAGSQPPNGMPPPEVTAVTVESRNVPVTFEYTGQTAGWREVEVRARVTGILLKRNYREGSAVAAGQSLFTVDPAPYQAALARAEADVASAEARLEQAKRNAARMKPLFEARAVSQKEYDDSVSAEAIADADVKAARARLTEGRLNLDYTRVESPIGGIAGRAQRSEGNYVTGPDVLLTTVTQIHPIYVLFGISDEERLKLNREVEAGRLVLPKNGAFDVGVKLAEGSVYANSGKLNFSDVRISGTTGTSEARAELPNPNGLLRPGQFVRVILKGAERPGAILVPQRAVLEGPKGKFVYVVSADGKAEARPVEVGDWQKDDWIITAGVNAGDKVIVDGVMKIGPGAPVRVAEQNAPKPGAPAAPANGTATSKTAAAN